ncbi:hypothetical protein Ahy_B06g082002 [Arachis hypogaea]|uniref:Uncharacterized protein n=1 Tax=Arachis hypogaea TaxID=3818 RepID=A0A444YMH7_ARAHY|nr:hypothetical protein Ahy_B06g082002 [Arachis hypogaea]
MGANSDVLERLNFCIPATVLNNLVLILYPFDHRTMKNGWLRQVTWVTLELLQHNRELQPVGQAAGLLSGFLGNLGANFQQLPICETSWKTMNKAIKEHKFDQIKEKYRKNAINHSKQCYTHNGGSKTMARKRHEEEAIAHIEGQDASSKELSQNDSLAQQLDSGVQIEEYQKEIAKLKVEEVELKVEATEEKAKRQMMKAEEAEEKAKRQTKGNSLRYLI